MAIKRQYFIPLGAALAGFAVGWALKPSSQTAATDPAAGGRTGRTAGANGGDTDRSRDPRPSRPLGVRPAKTVAAETTVADVQMQNRMENAFQSAASQRDRAKLVRMSEALGLNDEQVAKVEALLAEHRQDNSAPIGAAAGMSPQQTLEKAAEAAKALDAKFREILGTEQITTLDSLQTRQQENRIEARAQRELSDVVDRIDVNSAQREAVLEVLRKSVADDQAQLPESSKFLAESNLLAAGNNRFSDRSLEAMLVMGDTNVSADPMAVGRRMQELQRERNQRRADALAEILTPGQLQQYRAAVDGQAGVMGAASPRK